MPDSAVCQAWVGPEAPEREGIARMRFHEVDFQGRASLLHLWHCLHAALCIPCRALVLSQRGALSIAVDRERAAFVCCSIQDIDSPHCGFRGPNLDQAVKLDRTALRVGDAQDVAVSDEFGEQGLGLKPLSTELCSNKGFQLSVGHLAG